MQSDNYANILSCPYWMKARGGAEDVTHRDILSLSLTHTHTPRQSLSLTHTQTRTHTHTHTHTHSLSPLPTNTHTATHTKDLPRTSGKSSLDMPMHRRSLRRPQVPGLGQSGERWVGEIRVRGRDGHLRLDSASGSRGGDRGRPVAS